MGTGGIDLDRYLLGILTGVVIMIVSYFVGYLIGPFGEVVEADRSRKIEVWRCDDKLCTKVVSKETTR